MHRNGSRCDSQMAPNRHRCRQLVESKRAFDGDPILNRQVGEAQQTPEAVPDRCQTHLDLADLRAPGVKVR